MHAFQIYSNNPTALSQSLSQNVSTQGSLGTAAVVARDAFRGKVEILSDTKESIQSATRLAYDCVKNGMANEFIELITEKLENEQSMHGRVKYFFLVDSIMKRSHRKKDESFLTDNFVEFSGASFITIVQDQLPRLLGAAAPLGVSPGENHKKCAKILRLWIKRKIMPESLLQPYVDDIELFIRNSSLDDRAVIGQSRVIYGMLIEEYGSKATLQLPGHFLSHVSIEEDEIPKIWCNQEFEMKDVFLHHKDKKDVSAEGNGSHGRERTLQESPWSQPLIPHGQRPPFSYFWRPA
ncbi:hypothetical protein POM88_015480 [Heracleum sosnowskyi]|uniref:CID domain-containing protein n=1 Tax=Heracleum sosnowskyi TaxID=360622 RepID=A0AAD8MWG6_9APIA|nr:hypothetical protein POM88_015480 [Heracleum sosnowskyi]